MRCQLVMLVIHQIVVHLRLYKKLDLVTCLLEPNIACWLIATASKVYQQLNGVDCIKEGCGDTMYNVAFFKNKK